MNVNRPRSTLQSGAGFGLRELPELAREPVRVAVPRLHVVNHLYSVRVCRISFAGRINLDAPAMATRQQTRFCENTGGNTGIASPTPTNYDLQ